MPISILLVDDHAIIREGLHALLQNEPDFRVVGHAGTGMEALKILQSLHPDVIVLDVSMPELNGLEVARQVHQEYPEIRIVILSKHPNEAYAHQAILYGANAYVVKDAAYAETALAIRLAMQGLRYLSQPFTEKTIEEYAALTQDGEVEPYDTLTNRERQIFQMTVEGLSSKEIGDKLCISPRTAETHRQHLMRKLGLHNLSELIRYAIHKGILALDD